MILMHVTSIDVNVNVIVTKVKMQNQFIQIHHTYKNNKNHVCTSALEEDSIPSGAILMA